MNDKLDNGGDRVAIASFNRWKYLTLIWSLPLTLGIVGYHNLGAKLFTIEHLLSDDAVLIPNFIAIPLLAATAVFLVLHSTDVMRSRGIFVWTDGKIVKILGRKQVPLNDLNFLGRTRTGPLNSVITIPRYSGGEIRIPTGVIREDEDELIQSFDRFSRGRFDPGTTTLAND